MLGLAEHIVLLMFSLQCVADLEFLLLISTLTLPSADVLPNWIHYWGEGYFTKFSVGGPDCDEKVNLIRSKVLKMTGQNDLRTIKKKRGQLDWTSRRKWVQYASKWSNDRFGRQLDLL